ncbi:Iron-sulfur clusters transporter ATM1, mitochondrial [Cucumispora dikerogammari]|nr:Iron-sulfur clusters transporter ATM1, mitochondrial [Cucumispora dikerogammari]
MKKRYNRQNEKQRFIQDKKINIFQLIKLLFYLIVSSKEITLMVLLILVNTTINTYLEVKVASYLGEIGSLIGTNSILKIKNYNKYLILTSVYLILNNITVWAAIPVFKKLFTSLGTEQIVKVFMLTHEDFQKEQISYYVSNINRSARAVETIFEIIFLKVFYIMSSITFSIYKLHNFFGIQLALVCLAVVAMFFYCTYLFTMLNIKYHSGAIDAENFLINKLLEMLENRDTIVMYGMVEREIENVTHDFEKLQKCKVSFARYTPVLHFFQDFIFYSFFFIFIYVIVFNSNMNFDKKCCITSFSLLINLKSRINVLGSIMKKLYQTSASVAEGYLMLNIKNRNVQVCENIKQIELIRHSTGSSSNIFENISFKIQNVGSYIVVGANRDSKSSFIKTIMGFYKNTEGIFINRTPLDKLNLASFQNRIVYANQNSQLFSETIRYNLQYGNSKTFVEIESLCRVLKINDFIMLKPRGYAYKIGNNHCNLSEDEKQKLLFARAILREADVYVFDELISNIDKKTELFLIHKLNQILKNKIVIYITRNLELVSIFDEVIFVNNKTVTNPHRLDKLLAENECFFNFMKKQFK